MKHLIDRLLWLVLPEWLYRRLPDHCEICDGKRGGVRGNENIIEGIVMCDYCSANAGALSRLETQKLLGADKPITVGKLPTDPIAMKATASMLRERLRKRYQ